MRRRVTLAATMLIAPVLIASAPVATSPAIAQASAPDPVGALKRQLRDEHGVRISETTRYFYGEKTSRSGTRINGRLRLGRSGPVAADLTWRDLPAAKPHRVIRVRDDVYVSRSHHSGPVPDGTNWIIYPEHHRGSLGRDLAEDASLQPIDVYDPALVKALLNCSTSKPVPGGRLYRGTISYPALRKAAQGTLVNWTSGRPITARSKGKVSWQLWAGRDGLPKRLVTTDTAGTAKNPLVKRSDTRYTGWGSRPVITAPPAGEVISEAALLDYTLDQNTPIPEDSGNT
ncbi:hypothetical protein [Nonomuraea sp. SBT364]|uniref:hypothetical protein n=1 Tax=Nonomuraea sp. SBT364 TaxID=1580530 RepID=UPI00066D8591|nr:hypothetical protein [Nonomuraea sp. SBT364]